MAADLKMENSGVFSVDGVSFYLQHFDAGWSRSEQKNARAENGYPKKSDGNQEFVGTWSLRGELANIRQRIQQNSDGSYDVSYAVSSPAAIATKSLSVGFDLAVDQAAGKTIRVDDQGILLPALYGEMILFRRSDSSRLMIPAKTGVLVLEGDNLNIYIQDERKFNSPAFHFRLVLKTPEMQLTQTALAFKLSFRPYRSTPLNLGMSANMGFADPVADDRQGGWTDQGPANDLNALRPGRLHALGVDFQVLDPLTNAGRSCMVFAGPERSYFMQSASVPVPPTPEAPANVYLLHAAAWLPGKKIPIGIINAQYADGSTQTIPVIANHDVGNWWGQSPVANGAVGWRGQNASAAIGLYVSRFPLERKVLKQLTFTSTGTAVWMVAAASVSPDDIPLAVSIPTVITAGVDWAPYDNRADVAAGGALDLSFLNNPNDTPAGKYGPLTATSGGHFVFANRPDQPIRLCGANICFGTNFLDKAQADQLAERFVRYGYNTVRLHHYDGMLQKRGGASYELNPVQLDKLDYLFAAFKKRGIYINIDLFTIRKFSQAEIPDLGRDPDQTEYKALVPISDAAFGAWKKFAANLLTHVNPYTGMTWAEDPALIGICPVNEDTIFATVTCNAAIRKLYEVRFEQWLDQQPAAAVADRHASFNRFLVEMQVNADLRQREFLRSLAVKALVTGNNFMSTQAQAYIRDNYEYVDDHGYWDHPAFPENAWQLPFRFQQGNAVTAAATMPRYMIASRILGKPFTITEFNFVWPNAYRAQGGVLMAAYASLQDWDALYAFDYGGLSPRQLTLFQLSTDPVNLLADRLATLMYRRGDIAPAKNTIAFAVTERTGYGQTKLVPSRFPPGFTMLGLSSKIGSFPLRASARDNKIPLAANGIDAIVTDDPNAPQILAGKKVYPLTDGSLDHLLKDLNLAGLHTADGAIVSDTGQIRLWPEKGLMSVITERSECFILASNASLDGRFVQVKNGSEPCVVMVCAMDGHPLVESKRIVVAHLTDAANTNQAFADQSRTLMTDQGALPVLIRRGSATVTLKHTGDPLQAWALDNTGVRTRPVPLETLSENRTVLQVSTVSQQGTTLAYELARE